MTPPMVYALPPALREAPEPRGVDLRTLEDDGVVDRDDPRLREGVADLVAAIRAIPEDRLVGEHRRRRRQTMRLAGGAVTALSVLLVAAVVASLIALGQRDDAVASQRATASRTMPGRAARRGGLDRGRTRAGPRGRRRPPVT